MKVLIASGNCITVTKEYQMTQKRKQYSSVYNLLVYSFGFLLALCIIVSVCIYLQIKLQQSIICVFIKSFLALLNSISSFIFLGFIKHFYIRSLLGSGHHLIYEPITMTMNNKIEKRTWHLDTQRSFTCKLNKSKKRKVSYILNM